MTLATVGVALSVGVIGAILHFGIGLEWGSALLFGAIISATDPVSVLALFRKLGAPKKLTTIVEGESLFNDGTAVLIAGLMLGNYGRRKGMSPTTQVAVNSFWEYAAFVVNSLVFLLIGMEVQVGALAEHAGAIAWAVAAMLIARLICVYGLIGLTNLRAEPVPFKWQHILFWGGLRGSLSIALVLSLPTTLAGRQTLVTMIFGAVIFSLLAQGLTISPLLRWLNVSKPQPELKAYEIARGKLLAETAALAELDQIRSQGLVTDRVYCALQPAMERSREESSQRLSELDVADRDIDRQLKNQVLRRLIAAKKARSMALLRDSLMSEEAWRELNKEMDEELAGLQDDSALSEARKEMELWDRRNGLVGTFSKGMKQKLAIIRAIFHEPKVIFMDEPTAGLDPEASLAIREMILRLKGEGRTIVVCTHNLGEAERLADIVGILKRRLLVFDSLQHLQTGVDVSVPVEIEVVEWLYDYRAMMFELPFVSSVEQSGAIFQIEVIGAQENIPRLVRMLVERGVKIMAVRPRMRSLENIYLKCVRWAENGVQDQ